MIIVVLPFLHTVHVFLEADLFISRLGRVEPQQFSNLNKIVNRVLTDPKLHAFDKLFVELLAVIVQLGNFIEHVHALHHVVLLDHAQDLVLLQSLTIDVQRKFLRIDDTLTKFNHSGMSSITIVRDEKATVCNWHVMCSTASFCTRSCRT